MLFLHSNLYNDYFLNFLSCNFTYKIRAPGGPFWESITSFKTSFGVILKKRIWHVRSSKIRETSPAETFSREREENYWYWKYPNLKRDHSKKIPVAWYWNLRNELRYISKYLQEHHTQCITRAALFFKNVPGTFFSTRHIKWKQLQ